jgi:hypothetical protein
MEYLKYLDSMINYARCIILEGNIANEGNVAKWPLQNGVICVTTDGTCSTSETVGSVC